MPKETIIHKMLKDKIEDLPLIDKVVLEVLSLLDDYDCDYEQVIEKLSPDIAVKFLSVANSAYFGRKVQSIKQAVSLLGFSNMRSILITSLLLEKFDKRFKDFSFDKFHKQALFCVTVSRAFGEIINYEKPEDLFTVAILHNVGKLVIVVFFKTEHKEIVSLKKSEKLPSDEAELRVLGATHAEVGALVLERFKIPQDICDAVRFHNAKNRTIPQGSNFQLELIARESARIVDDFVLPKIDPVEVMEKLKETVKKGKKTYQEEMMTKVRPEEYQESFALILEQISSMIHSDMKRIFKIEFLKRKKKKGL